MICSAYTVYGIRFLGADYLVCNTYSIQFSIVITKFHYLHYIKRRKNEKKNMHQFFSLVERMGAFVIGFGNLCADIKRPLQSR